MYTLGKETTSRAALLPRLEFLLDHSTSLSKLGFHEKAHRVNPVLVLFYPTAVAGASWALSFDPPPGFHSHSSRVRVLGPVHDEVRGVRALQADGRPRRSAEFAQSPGQGGLGSGGRSLACSAGASSSSSSAFSVVRVVQATPLVRVVRRNRWVHTPRR
jgi:hypothetical protein